MTNPLGTTSRARSWLLLLLLISGPALAASVPVLDIQGPIGPATRDYLHQGLEKARSEGAPLVVLRLDTPGGLAESMREMILDILASPIPVVGFVAPDGARAASAGTYLLYACHVAAMAPATHLGAATPVAVGGLPGEPARDEDGKGGSALERKLVNDAVAYIRTLARLRGRNADWAESAVREAASIEAGEALRLKVIDEVAPDLPALLAALDGRELTVGGRSVRLATRGLTPVEYPPDWRTRLLAAVTDPNVAYLLLLIGIYGLIFEFAHPGAFAPGVVGAVSLLIALFSFQLLPVSYVGVLLTLLGVALMVAEAFAPSFGALGMGGAVALAAGAVMLFDTSSTGIAVNRWLIAAIALVSLLLLTVLLGFALRARRHKVVSGPEQLIGMEATAMDDFEGTGLVHVHGERWRAHIHGAARKDQRLRVMSRDGLTLQVESIDEGGKDHG